MASANFYQIFIAPKQGVSTDRVKKGMDLALDWFRIDPKTWIVYTTSTANKWQERLRPMVEPGGHLFICKLDISDRQGWMTPAFWEWLRASPDDRPAKTKSSKQADS
jgi:hypothetical protein